MILLYETGLNDKYLTWFYSQNITPIQNVFILSKFSYQVHDEKKNTPLTKNSSLRKGYIFDNSESK